MYQKAKEAVVKGQDLKLGEVHVSPVCGFIGGASHRTACPVFGADHKVLRKF
jgi:rubrerythrin